ncbi:hypothetical protein [Micromonospora sp. NPDC005220]|uniref:hypothetical protein n=1 Tax=Micromonospora sp. NPDC005220 TaxID=3155589 RepID=UPI0033AF08B6
MLTAAAVLAATAPAHRTGPVSAHRAIACAHAVDLVLVVIAAAANLTLAAVLFSRGRGGTTVPRIFGRPQPLPRLRAAMHLCLGLGMGVGWLTKDIFPPQSTADTVLFNVVRVLLVAALVTALLSAFRHPRPIGDKTAR